MTRALILVATALAALASPGQDTRGRVFPADWSERDFEGRWHAYAEATDRAPAVRPDWLAALRATREYAVLEWIAITEAGFLAGDLLIADDAPNWIRCALWASQQLNKRPTNDSHGHQLASRRLSEAQYGLVDAWFELHPGSGVRKAVAIPDETRARAALYLPPLKAEDVLAGLSPPEKVIDFGARTRATPGEVYLHQVRRSLAAFSYAAVHHQEPWLMKVEALLRHSDAAVRRQTLLAYTMINPVGIPVMRLVDLARDQKEAPETREGAILALSFAFISPLAWAEVHRVAEDPAHPGFNAAVSRLGDVGDLFSLARLDASIGKPGGDGFLVRAARDRIARRESYLVYQEIDEARVTALLVRAAHVALANDSVSAAYLPWMNEALVSDRRRASVRRILETVKTTFKAPANVEVRGIAASRIPVPISHEDVTASVRTFAAAALEIIERRAK
jgi:hypothetical protein